MAITNQTLIKKMSSEIQEAMLHHGNEQAVRERAASIKLLAELILEEEDKRGNDSPAVQEPTAEEVRRMMGTAGSSSRESQKKQKTSINHDEANGSSIFDF